MRHPILSLGLAVAMAALASAESAGQVGERPLRIAPIVGWYHPTQDLVRGTESSDVALRTSASPLFGASVETTLPRTTVGLRGQLLYAPNSGITTTRFDGFQPCGSNCSRAVYRTDPLASGTVLVGAADALIGLPGIGPVRPYAVVGGGARRYSFNRQELGTDFSQTLSDHDARFIAHVGAGVAADIGPVELTAEAGDYFGHYTTTDREGVPTVRMQHDVGVTLGFRWALH
jgi:hypothetical protein